MPICSYLVFPVEGEKSTLRQELSGWPECEVDGAKSENVLLVMSETRDLDHQKELEERFQEVSSIQCLAQVFGEIDPEAGTFDTKTEDA